jgi:ATP-binding cassette subfamily B protein
VSAWFGLHIPVSRIRLYGSTNNRGTSLRGLIEAAEKLNLQAKGAKTREIHGLPIPTIFHMVLENGMQHFVVVYKIRKNKICFMDPAFGKLKTQSCSDFLQSWTGVILLITPGETFQKGNEKISTVLRFRQLIQPHKRLMMPALLGAGIYALMGMCISVYVQKIFDVGLKNSNRSIINLLSLVMIGLLLVRMTIGYLKSILVLKTGQQIDRQLIMGYYKHLLNLPQRFFDSMQIGEIISRINDAVRIRIFINDTALNVVVNLLSITLCLLLMFIYYWKLALFILCTIPVYILIYGVVNSWNARWQRRTMETSAAFESQLVESIQGVATIRRFNVTEAFDLKTNNRFIPLMRAVFTSSRNSLLMVHITEGLTGFLIICVLWWGSSLVLDGTLNPGELMSFYILTALFALPVQALIGANRPMQDALIAADRLFEIIDLEIEAKEKENLEELPEGDIVFEGVSFKYGPGNPVFSGLSLRLPRYRITGIMGENGSGKSTLLSLVHKFYPPDAGNISIGKRDIRDISTHTLRKYIAAAPQHTDLFQGDLISNIALGCERPDRERIIDICQRLGLDEWINQMPDQYRTVVSEQGANLSGGQRQKIGIARALYRDPAILFLDEATSALDPDSEQKVMNTLHWFMGQHKTIIIIAHRKAILNECDCVVTLKQGKLVTHAN